MPGLSAESDTSSKRQLGSKPKEARQLLLEPTK